MPEIIVINLDNGLYINISDRRIQYQYNMFKFTQVAVCTASVAENLDYKDPTYIRKIVKGDLHVMLQTATGIMLLKMLDFEYGINPNDQVLYEDKDSQWKLMLCLDSNQSSVWILKINDNVELFFKILSEKCKVMHQRASKMIIQAGKDEQNYPTLEDYSKIKEEKEEQAKAESTETKLINASKSLSKFLAAAGLILSKGFQALGDYFSKRVENVEEIKISPTTKDLIEKSVDASKKILMFSTEKVAGIFRLATNQAANLQQSLLTTETGKKLKQNGTIDSANNYLRVGLEAITNVYDGLTQGYDEATLGLSKGTNQVISAKYGKQAGDAALKMAEGYRNVNKIPRVVNKALKLVLVETVKNQAIKKETK